MRLLIWLAGLFLLAVAAPPATAQSNLGGKVVATCGTPGAFPTAGRPSGFTVDPTGKLCTDASGGGGGDATAANQTLQITQETLTNTTLGLQADPAYTSGSGSTIAILKGIYVSVNGSIPAGTAIIGKVGIDQTTPGTTNLVALSAETTKVIGTVNQGTSPWVVSGAVTIAANSAVNVAQINGVTPLMGNGATGTGSPRATISNDNTAIANWGQGATGATAPTGASQAGCRAQNAEATALTNGQMGGIACDLTLKQIVIPFANPENWVQGTTSAMTGTTSTSLIASAGGSLRNYVWVSCVNSHATVGTFVTIQDGSGGTALATVAAAANYGGQIDATPIPIKSTAATGIFVANVTTGANVICSARGYKGL